MKYADELQRLLPGGRFSGPNYVVKNPTRADAHEGSFSINAQTGVWADFALDGRGTKGGDLNSLAKYLGRTDLTYDIAPPVPVVVEWTPCEVHPVGAEILMRPDQGEPYIWRPTYIYRTTDNLVQFAVRRVDMPGGGKRFEQAAPFYHRDRPDEIVWRLHNRRQFRTIFGAELLDSKPWPVLVVEGEKTCLAVRRVIAAHQAQFLCVCWSGGSGAPAQTHWAPLFGREVVLVPDRDSKKIKGSETQFLAVEQQPGMKAMQVIFQQLRAKCQVLGIMPYTVGIQADGWDLADATEGECLEYIAGPVNQKLIALRSAVEKAAKRVPKVIPLSEDMRENELCFLYEKPGKIPKPLPVIQNTERLCEVYGIRVRYDRMRKSIEFTAPSLSLGSDSAENVALTQLTSLAELNNLPSAKVPEYVFAIAAQREFCPVQDWILSRPWDGRSRIVEFFNTVHVEEADRRLRDIYLRKWVLAAVAAVFEPDVPVNRGRFFDSILVLQGGEGVHKTSWFQALAPDGFVGKSKSARDIEKPDTVTQLIRHWISELGETNRATTHGNIDAIMAFTSMSRDSFRTPYSRAPSEFQRRTVFCGTVNNPEFLPANRDNRRWFVLPVTGLDHRHGIDMQQFFAEVYQTIFLTGENWWLDDADHRLLLASNQRFREADPYEEIFLSQFATDGQMTWLTASAIADVLKIPTQPREMTRLRSVLKRLCRERKGRSSQEFEVRRLSAMGEFVPFEIVPSADDF